MVLGINYFSCHMLIFLGLFAFFIPNSEILQIHLAKLHQEAFSNLAQYTIGNQLPFNCDDNCGYLLLKAPEEDEVGISKKIG